jgi:hypothetical protein
MKEWFCRPFTVSVREEVMVPARSSSTTPPGLIRWLSSDIALLG